MKPYSFLFTAAFALSISSVAFADPQTSDAPPAAAPEDAPPADRGTDPPAPEDRTVYLSISPLHLLGPVVELTGEVRVQRKIGLALIGGFGSLAVGGERFNAWEVGGQFVSYPIGHFDHGMQLGLEALYAGVSTDEKASISGTGTGFAAGPIIGYKLATQVGFSLNLQAGVEYLLVRAEASSSSGARASAEQSRLIPVLNANVGWSF